MEVHKIIAEGEFFNEEQSLLIKNFKLSDEQQNLLKACFEKLRFQSDISCCKLSELLSVEFQRHDELISKVVSDTLIIFNQIADKDSIDTLNHVNAYSISISEIIDKTREIFNKLKDTFDNELGQYVSLFLSLFDEIKHSNNKQSDTIPILNQDNISKALIDSLSNSFFKAIIQFSESFYSFNFKHFEAILDKVVSSARFEVDAKLNNGDSLKLKAFIPGIEATDQFTFAQFKDFKVTADKRFIEFFKSFEHQLELTFFTIFKYQNATDLTSNNFTERSHENVKSVSDKIQKISVCFFNEYFLKIRLELIKININKVLRQLHVDLSEILKLNLGSKNQQLINDIDTLIRIFNQPKSSDLSQIFKITDKIDPNIYSNIENLINSSLHSLEIMLELLPERYEFVKNVIFSDIKLDKITQFQFYKVLALKIGSDILYNHIKDNLGSENFIISNKINEIDNEIISQNRLIKFSIFKQDSNQLIKFDDNKEINVEKFLNDEKQKAIGINAKIDLAMSAFEQAYIKMIDTSGNFLNISFFKDQARFFSQYLPKRQSGKMKLYFKKFVEQIKIKYNKLIYYFWFHQSNAQILSDDIIEKQKASPSVQRLLNVIEPLILNKQVRFDLPFYYRQLFLNNQTFKKEFWYGRHSEIERGRIAFNRFINGYSGSLLITGERLSGKSFLVNYLASHLIKSGKIILIEAPNSGEINLKFLLKRIQEKTGVNGDFKKIFTAIEPGSIIIIDDLELWWEKSENGSLLIKQIVNFINEYCHEIFFIVSVNTHSFKPMNSIIDIQNLFLDIIYCKPFNAKSLQNIVLARHRITSLKFKLASGQKIGGKKDEALFLPKNYAQLFSKYFNFSHGNIGVCLHSWMANISGIEGDCIIMNLPQRIELSELDLLREDELLILYHLTIHKKMDIKKMSRVLLINESEFQQHLLFLKRIGIVIENEQIFEINPFINHLIINILKKREML